MNKRLQCSLVLVFSMCCLCVATVGLLLWKAKRKYALNRQLIAALIYRDSEQARGLVNAGADPNTRYDPSPVPTIPLLLNLWLHRTPAPVNKSATAFLFVCGGEWNSADYQFRLGSTYPEDVPLFQAMVEHGADCTATYARRHETALHGAVESDHPNLVALLLERGVNINKGNDNGTTPLMKAVENKDAFDDTPASGSWRGYFAGR